MHRQKFPAHIVAVLLVFIAPHIASAEWKNSLKPKGAPAGRLTLVENGKPRYAIQIPAHPTKIEHKAAEELQSWIERISTGRPKIVDSHREPSVVIHTDPSLGEEGYRVAVNGINLELAGGTTRGCLNAVYALLEEDLCCRFYTNESIKLPTGKTLVAEPVARTFIPQLRLRDPYYAVAFDPVWSVRNRTNAPKANVSEELGGHIDYGDRFVHTAGALVPPKEYFDSHPEYFALDEKGKRYTAQLCTTHPEVARIVTASVLKTLDAHPETEIISVSKNDSAGNQLCQCERCRKIRAAEGGSEMGCQLVLVNAVAEVVEKSHPSVVIDTLAYLDTVQPPKTARPRHNVVIRLCNDEVGSWKHPFTAAEQCEVAKTAIAWSKIHDRIYVWDYTVNFSHYLAPMPNIDVMAANIRFWAKNHAEGVMLQGGYEGPAENDEMKCWVASKLLWDPTRDEKELVQDFIWGYYGNAAPALAEYDAILNGLRQDYKQEMFAPERGIRYPMDSPFFTKQFIDQATEIFSKAKALAGDDQELLRRVERAELPILYVEISRGRDFVGPNYANIVAEFERIARREHISHLQEAASDFEDKLAGWKAMGR